MKKKHPLHVEVDLFKSLIKYEGDKARKSRVKGRLNDLDLLRKSGHRTK